MFGLLEVKTNLRYSLRTREFISSFKSIISYGLSALKHNFPFMNWHYFDLCHHNISKLKFRAVGISKKGLVIACSGDWYLYLRLN